jgi:polyisoprenoid-binding protein YceI
LRKGLKLAALGLLIAGCGAPPARLPSPHPDAVPPASPPAAAPAAQGARYRIDSAHSELRVLVYRAGAMAALGHDHVIVNRALEGWVTFSGEVASAVFFLTVPTSGFVVDEDAARRQEGADFSEVIDADAKAGTLHNMRGPAVLDAQGHPAITVRSVSIATATGGAQATGAQATVSVSVAGHESSLVVPFTVDSASGRLHARVDFSVQQTRLGLTPFSVFLGALRVEDELHVKLDLVAVQD